MNFSRPNARILRDACDSMVKRSGGQGAPGGDRFRTHRASRLQFEMQLELPGNSARIARRFLLKLLEHCLSGGVEPRGHPQSRKWSAPCPQKTKTSTTC